MIAQSGSKLFRQGGHAFPRRKSPNRKTTILTVPFSPEQTKQILRKCKTNGISIANALFSLSAFAWSRVCARKEGACGAELPAMMYSALNVRPYVRPEVREDKNASYWSTAIGYFNVVLPAFLPTAACSNCLADVFWHRAREAKRQITKATKHPLLVSRTRAMAAERAARARAWAREDDEKDAGSCTPPAPRTAPSSCISSTSFASAEVEPEDEKKLCYLPPAPSTALIGLSMLGNLDTIFAHASYPALNLHTLTPGNRQRPGASLLYGHTFKGRLVIALEYDELGFMREADGIAEWWRCFVEGVEEFLKRA